MTETVISIGFNRAIGKFNLLEKKTDGNCWWPTSKEYDTLPEAEAALADINRKKFTISLRDRLYRDDQIVEYVGELPFGAPLPGHIHTSWLTATMAIDTQPDGSVWFRFVQAGS